MFQYSAGFDIWIITFVITSPVGARPLDYKVNANALLNGLYR